MTEWLARLLRPALPRQGLLVEHYLGGSSGSAAETACRAGYPWTEQMSRKLSRKVRETRSSGSRKRPERGQKCRQRLELGIHGLKSWGRNRSRKVREKGEALATHLCLGQIGKLGCQLALSADVAKTPIDIADHRSFPVASAWPITSWVRVGLIGSNVGDGDFLFMMLSILVRSAVDNLPRRDSKLGYPSWRGTGEERKKFARRPLPITG